MRAVGLDRFGGPEVLHVVELPEPHAGPGEVRVRVHAAGVNPIDTMIRTGAMGNAHQPVNPPLVPGMDIAGTLDELGEDLPEGFDLALGSPVTGIVVNHDTHGGYAEHVVLPAESVTSAPKGASWEQAASFLMNALTAQATLDVFGLPAGATLGVTGAAGAVGGYLTQLGHLAGLRVLAQASQADAELVRGFGADEVVPRDAGADGFLALAPQGVDAMGDPASMMGAALPAIRDGGWLGIFLDWDGEPVRGIRVHHNIVMQQARHHDTIARLAELAGSGELAMRVEQTYPLEEAAAAHARLAEGHLRGRLILTL